MLTSYTNEVIAFTNHTHRSQIKYGGLNTVKESSFATKVNDADILNILEGINQVELPGERYSLEDIRENRIEKN